MAGEWYPDGYFMRFGGSMCPNCGYCPTCGRNNDVNYPQQYWNTIPPIYTEYPKPISVPVDDSFGSPPDLTTYYVT